MYNVKEFQDNEDLKNNFSYIHHVAATTWHNETQLRLIEKIMSLYYVNAGFNFLSLLHWKARNGYYNV